MTGLTVSKAEMEDMMNADEEAAAVVVERLHGVLVKGGMVPDDHRCVPTDHAAPAGSGLECVSEARACACACASRARSQRACKRASGVC